MNLVMTDGPARRDPGHAEGEAFDERELAAMMTLGKSGIKRLIQMQRRTLGLKRLPTRFGPDRPRDGKRKEKPRS